MRAIVTGPASGIERAVAERCVSPDWTHTAMTDAHYPDPLQRAAAKRNPLQRIGVPA